MNAYGFQQARMGANYTYPSNRYSKNKRECGSVNNIKRKRKFYLGNMKKYFTLKQELSAWDTLSDEALENFEKLLVL